jgi:hypothetical protein
MSLDARGIESDRSMCIANEIGSTPINPNNLMMTVVVTIIISSIVAIHIVGIVIRHRHDAPRHASFLRPRGFSIVIGLLGEEALPCVVPYGQACLVFLRAETEALLVLLLLLLFLLLHLLLLLLRLPLASSASSPFLAHAIGPCPEP